MTEALATLTAVELRRRIARKDVSPVELLDACLERIAALNGAVNALAATQFAVARVAARAAERAVLRGDELGVLHGLPAGIKDLQETRGLLTTYGSPLYRDFVPTQDAAMVALVRAAGAIIVAKTNVPEFGAGANTRNPVWGATGNPFDPSRIAGGSSGGAAAALACDMLPVATGSDTGGSLRIPAAMCGVVGFRPSAGLVPVDTRTLGWSPISVQGPMGRTVGDTRLLFAAQLACDVRDPLSHPLSPAAVLDPRGVDLGRLRAAWTADFGHCPVAADIRALMREKIGALRHLFRACDEIAFDFGEADRCFDIVRAQQFLARHQRAYARNPHSLGANVRANYEMGAAMSLEDAAWAHAEQTRIFRGFQAHFRDYDLILAPTAAVSPFPWTEPYLAALEGKALRNYYHWLALTYYVTLVTNPALSLPCGLDHAGMPFGLQVVGRCRGDVALLDIAEAMEQAFARLPGLARPRPDTTRLRVPRPELTAIVTHPPIAP